MVVVGFAVTLVPVVELRPVDGDQVNVVAPLAVSVVELPLQIVADATLMMGFDPTVTVAVVSFKHPFRSVPVIVYCVVDAGFAVTTGPLVPLRPVPGLQLYEFAPFAVSVAVPPGQIVALFTVIVGSGLTVTMDVACAVQVALVPTTV